MVSQTQTRNQPGTQDFQDLGHQLAAPDLLPPPENMSTAARNEWAFAMGQLHQANPYQVLALLHVAFRTGTENFGAKYQLARIASETRMHKDTVSKALNWWVSKGVLHKQRRYSQSTVWRIQFNQFPTRPETEEDSAESVQFPTRAETDGNGYQFPTRPAISFRSDSTLKEPQPTTHALQAHMSSTNEQDTVVVPPVAPEAQAETPPESVSGGCGWELEDGQPCGAAPWRNHSDCLSHVVETWWADPETGDLELGKTWKNGKVPALRWYTQNPDALAEQIARLADAAEEAETANHCAKCGEPFGDNRVNYHDSGKCLGCTFRPAATTLCFACEVTPVSRPGEPCQNCMDAATVDTASIKTICAGKPPSRNWGG